MSKTSPQSAGLWRYRWGPGNENSVRGVKLMRVTNGKIVEALGYVKGGS